MTLLEKKQELERLRSLAADRALVFSMIQNSTTYGPQLNSGFEALERLFPKEQHLEKIEALEEDIKAMEDLTKLIEMSIDLSERLLKHSPVDSGTAGTLSYQLEALLQQYEEKE